MKKALLQQADMAHKQIHSHTESLRPPESIWSQVSPPLQLQIEIQAHSQMHIPGVAAKQKT